MSALGDMIREYEQKMKEQEEKIQRYEKALNQILSVYDEDLIDIQVARKMERIAKEVLEK